MGISGPLDKITSSGCCSSVHHKRYHRDSCHITVPLTQLAQDRVFDTLNQSRQYSFQNQVQHRPFLSRLDALGLCRKHCPFITESRYIDRIPLVNDSRLHPSILLDNFLPPAINPYNTQGFFPSRIHPGLYCIIISISTRCWTLLPNKWA